MVLTGVYLSRERNYRGGSCEYDPDTHNLRKSFRTPSGNFRKVSLFRSLNFKLVHGDEKFTGDW